MNEQENYMSELELNGENSLPAIVRRYLIYWRWYLLSVAVFLSIAYFYLRYQAPQYEVTASVLVKDDKKGGALSELSAFEDLGLLNKTGSLDNEIEILRSRSLMQLVARELRLNISYITKDGPLPTELFLNSPLYLEFVSGDSTAYELETEMLITLDGNSSFELSDAKKKNTKKLNFGSVFNWMGHQVKIQRLTDIQNSEFKNKTLAINLYPIDLIVDYYRRVIKIEPANKTANVINLTLRDPVKERAAAILNNLIKQHNLDALADKNQVSKNTADFINDRIKYITTELSEVEGQAEEFKTRHKLVDVESEAKLFLQTGSLSESEILEASTQRALAGYMIDFMKAHSGVNDLMPANLGLNEQATAAMISEYNRLTLERNKVLRNSSEQNPTVSNLTDQLFNIRKSILESLANYYNALNIRLNELDKRESGNNSRIATVPKYEREYRIIQRQQQIKETLYLYLLQKREETNIALAVTVANAKVIDRAYGSAQPVGPKKKVIYLLSFLTATFLFVAVLYLREVLDNKVHGKRDIDRLGLPLLGDIPESDSKDKIVVSVGNNSSAAEAFRLLRTNVDFMLSDFQKTGKVIFLTSTIGKEGKSFVAVNLASSIAISGKKVLLMGMDVRAPKILEYLQLESRIGITNYISDAGLSIDDVIMKAPIMENLDILPSGSIPPNPSELLMKEKVNDLISRVREMYEYIIVDTAPIGMVTDTLLLSKYADAVVYVVRANFLDRRLLTVPLDLHREKRLPNMAILINGTDKQKGYGYGYGYGYELEAKKFGWMQKFKAKYS